MSIRSLTIPDSDVATQVPQTLLSRNGSEAATEGPAAVARGPVSIERFSVIDPRRERMGIPGLNIDRGRAAALKRVANSGNVSARQMSFRRHPPETENGPPAPGADTGWSV